MQITKIHVYIYSYVIRLEAAMTVIKRDSLIDFVVTLSWVIWQMSENKTAYTVIWNEKMETILPMSYSDL